MIVSWNWLADYVKLSVTPDELATRLMMAGLNHESTESIAGDDFAIDLEITSNRPDCLGHHGIAREAAVLYGVPLTIPNPRPKSSDKSRATSLVNVIVECPDLAPQYIARVVRGVKIKPSPEWMQSRLRTLGIGVVNNVVDITNYVLMECGQPLHAFDLAKLAKQTIVVRTAKSGETLTAIDHRSYVLDPSMCVIADGEKPIAIAGVMGGADSEVSEGTRDVVIEAARFAPLNVRTTARKLTLKSPSSYRFERGVDPEGVDWASRRCAELLIDLAGGELAEGVVDVSVASPKQPQVTLRFSQVKRVLGIEIAPMEIRRIITALGCTEQNLSTESITTIAPSWRRDLTREIDLVEEVARIHGYEHIPEDARVPMAASHKSDADRVLEKVRSVMTGSGYSEALTASVVPESWSNSISPWSTSEPLVAATPMLKGADRLRRSVIPSLLDARRINESLSNPDCQLFETARIYLSDALVGSDVAAAIAARLPKEQWTLTAVSGSDFLSVKGVAESLVEAINPAAQITISDLKHPLMTRYQYVALHLDGELLGVIGSLSAEGLKTFGLREKATVLEISLSLLAKHAVKIAKFSPLSPYPATTRDVNLIVDEPLRWQQLESVVRAAAGPSLETLEYRDTYRDTSRDGENKKRILFSFSLRGTSGTLTAAEADSIRDTIIAAATTQLSAKLLG